MISCKKTIIATCFTLLLPITGWTQAPVVDDSENFAMLEQQRAAKSPVVNSNYDFQQEDGSALVKEDNYAESNDDLGSSSGSEIKDNAKLIDAIQNLQKEVQELRGQLEVQAHDLKLLQQQQLSFYKDLDSRLGSTGAKAAPMRAPTDMSLGTKPLEIQAPKSAAIKPKIIPAAKPLPQVSRANPADEQISYLAAYELVQNKRYDDAITAMQTFAQKYPNGGYTANAEYWLGELFLVKKEYSKAIEHFQVVLDQFPSSSKSAACMLKSGYAYAASGQHEEAVKRLQQVISTYPDTATAQLAKSKLETINPV